MDVPFNTKQRIQCHITFGEPMLTCQPRQTKPGWFSHMAGYRVQIDDTTDTTAQSPVAKTKRRNREGLLSPASPGSRYPDHEQFKRPAWDEHTISSSHDVATDSTSAIPTRACFWARMAAPARDPLLMPPPNAEASRTV